MLHKKLAHATSGPSSGTLFSHSGVNSTEHGMFDHIGPVRHKTLFLPLVEKLV